MLTHGISICQLAVPGAANEPIFEVRFSAALRERAVCIASDWSRVGGGPTPMGCLCMPYEGAREY